MVKTMANSRTIQIKRIYDSPSADDGCRVLVDRLWPRGIKKQDAQIDFWAKQVAPTTELRQWFDHDPAKFDEFSSRYTRELASNSDAVEQIFDAAGDRAITLLYAARDTTCNHAIVLRELLRIAQ
jgi:uncharacterized protein YeaO (DUF488 family)